MERTYKFIASAAGIFLSFFFFGIFQEKITKTQYVNPDGSVEYFTYSMSLVLMYCFVNYVLSTIILRIYKPEDSTPTIYYSLNSLVYFLSMVCTNMALQFISYPTQVVAKSCKPIPVMIFGVLLGRKSYPFRKYIFVGLIVLGIMLFLFKETKENKLDQASNKGLGIGEVFILSSLFMDGISAAFQERMKAEYQTKSLCLMLNLNKWASVCLFVLWIVTKEVYSFIAFVQRQNSVIWKLGALSLCGFFGQFAMLSCVMEFGTLPATIVATVRKFFTLLASVLLLGNSLLPRQWIASVIIFTGLFLDILYGKSETKVK